MRYENLGPVANEDGSPTELTRSMLEGTGRDPVAFAASAGRWVPLCGDCFYERFPDRYLPDTLDFATCHTCGQDALSTNVNPKDLR